MTQEGIICFIWFLKYRNVLVISFFYSKAPRGAVSLGLNKANLVQWKDLCFVGQHLSRARLLMEFMNIKSIFNSWTKTSLVGSLMSINCNAPVVNDHFFHFCEHTMSSSQRILKCTVCGGDHPRLHCLVLCNSRSGNNRRCPCQSFLLRWVTLDQMEKGICQSYEVTGRTFFATS